MHSLKVFDIGFLRKVEHSSIRGKWLNDVNRGKISTFSKSARRRMREFLVSMIVPDMQRVGITLTLPYNPWSDEYLQEFASIVHRFRVSWLRKYPNSGCVFRVELQQRGAPHLHLISWHRSECFPSLPSEYLMLWLNAVGTDLKGGKLDRFVLHGTQVDCDLNTIASIRYLCDHSSKSKQAQLGYKGKQWGIWGRRNFIEKSSQVIHLDDRALVLFDRFCRRLMRRSIKGDCVFGFHKVHPRGIRRIGYVSEFTIKKYFGFEI